MRRTWRSEVRGGQLELAELCSWDGVSAQTAASTPTYAHRACWVSQSGTETEEFAGRRAAQRPRAVAQAIAWGRVGKRRTIRDGGVVWTRPRRHRRRTNILAQRELWAALRAGSPVAGRAAPEQAPAPDWQSAGHSQHGGIIWASAGMQSPGERGWGSHSLAPSASPALLLPPSAPATASLARPFPPSSGRRALPILR